MNIASRSTPTSPLILILIILLGFVAGYFYAGFIGSSDGGVLPAPGAQDSSFLRFKDLTLNFSLLDTPTFSSLKIYGESPIRATTGGRTDIFNP